MQEQQKELFEDYEIRNWNFSPRVYKILAASAILNLLAIFVIAQTNLLTRKGCDSPFVSSICQVLDTIYVGSTLLGTDAEYVSKDYQKTELGDADITYIDVSSDTPPLKYPEGYFALANPEQTTIQDPMIMSTTNTFGNQSFGGFSTNPTMPPLNNSGLLASKPKLPPVNNNPIIGDLPSSINGNPTVSYPKMPRARFPRNLNPKPSKIPNNSPKDLPKLGDETAAVNKPDKPADAKDDKKDAPQPTTPDKNLPEIKSEPVSADMINKKPLQDFGDAVLDKVSKKEVDLTKNFSVEMLGSITEDGKFDRKKSGYVKTDGDKAMIDVAKSAIEAIGDSGLLTYLKNLGIDKVNFTLVQDDKQIYAVITSEQKTEQRAKSVSSGLNGWISIGKATNSDPDTKNLLDAASVENQGKNFVLNFKLAKPVAQEMINRQLQKAEAKKNQPNSTAQNANADVKTGK